LESTLHFGLELGDFSALFADFERFFTEDFVADLVVFEDLLGTGFVSFHCRFGVHEKVDFTWFLFGNAQIKDESVTSFLHRTDHLRFPNKLGQFPSCIVRDH
jgi:hypothetical protein